MQCIRPMFQSEQSRWRLRRRSDIPVKSYTALKSHLAPRPVRPHPRPERIEAASRFKTYAFHYERGICHELETEKMRYRLTDFGDSDVFRRLNRRQYQTATRC